VYISAVAEELTVIEFERGVELYNGRFSNPAEHGVRTIEVEDVQAPALYRLYRATAQESWVLDPAGRPDHRTPVNV